MIQLQARDACEDHGHRLGEELRNVPSLVEPSCNLTPLSRECPPIVSAKPSLTDPLQCPVCFKFRLDSPIEIGPSYWGISSPSPQP
jgi:hypothetical protein